jgi:ribosomal protein L7/L12
VILIALASFAVGFLLGRASGGDHSLRDESRMIPTEPLPEDLEQRVRYWLDRGKKIEAIKEVRDRTGYGLKQSMNIVEEMQKGRFLKELTDRDKPPR